MPSSVKNAVLSPLQKKPSLDFEIFSNFRPVSNLKFLSKVIEKAAAIRLTNYLCDNVGSVAASLVYGPTR